MNRIINYIFAAVMTLLSISFVDKFITNLEITEELTLFMFASIYLNFLNLMNNHDLKTQMKVNHIMDAAVMKELCGEERCKKAAEKVRNEYISSIVEEE